MLEYSAFGNGLLWGLILFGFILLFFGGDWLCKGASALALKLNISPVIIGLTIVAVATSMPEMLTSLYAAQKGSPGIAIGNIVGSNLANIGLIMGIAALICPIAIQVRLIKIEMPILMLISALFWWMASEGVMERGEGLVLMVIMASYTLFMLFQAKKESKKAQEVMAEEVDESFAKHSWNYCIAFVFLGAASLHIGAEVLVQSSVVVASRMGMSDALIGLTIVAIGTSLPELAASVMAAVRGQADLCAGNIVGSNLFNIILIGGTVITFYPLEVDPGLLAIDFPAMMLVSAIIWLAFVTGRIVSRSEGGVLITLYTLTMAYTASVKMGWL